MKIAVLGLGVIGTTYAYAFQQAGHDTFHIIRDGKQVPASIPVHILDGRIKHSLLLEIFTHKGVGTAIIQNEQEKFYKKG